MRIDYREDIKSCYIWIPFQNKDDYKSIPLYKSTIESNKAKGYSTCVYVGGTVPITSVVNDLLSTTN